MDCTTSRALDLLSSPDTLISASVLTALIERVLHNSRAAADAAAAKSSASGLSPIPTNNNLFALIPCGLGITMVLPGRPLKSPESKTPSTSRFVAFSILRTVADCSAFSLIPIIRQSVRVFTISTEES